MSLILSGWGVVIHYVYVIIGYGVLVLGQRKIFEFNRRTNIGLLMILIGGLSLYISFSGGLTEDGFGKRNQIGTLAEEMIGYDWRIKCAGFGALFVLIGYYLSLYKLHMHRVYLKYRFRFRTACVGEYAKPCGKCKAKNTAKANFCHGCGRKF